MSTETTTPTSARDALVQARADQASAEQARDALQTRADVGEDVASDLVVARERAVIAYNRAAGLVAAADAEALAEARATWQAEADRLDAEVAQHRSRAAATVATIERKAAELADHAAAVDTVNHARMALGPDPAETDHTRQRPPSGAEMPGWITPRVRALLDQRSRLPLL